MSNILLSIYHGLKLGFVVLAIGAILVIFSAPTIFGYMYFSTDVVGGLVLYVILAVIIGFVANYLKSNKTVKGEAK